MEVDESTNDDSLLSEDSEPKLDAEKDSAGKKLDEGSWEHAYSSNKQSKEKKSEVDKARWSRLVATLMENQDTPLISLNPRTRSHLQDLLVEGELQEVSLDETTHMWRVLQAASHPPSMLEDTLLSFNNASGGNDENKAKKAAPKKRKSQIEGLDEPPKSPHKSPIKKTKFGKISPIDGKTPKGVVKKKTLPKALEKKKKEGIGGGAGGVGGLGGGGGPSKEGPKKKTTGVGRKKKMQSATSNSLQSDDDDDDTDEACAASKCQHPGGQNVDWVQCDGCEGWFHYICVGLKAGDVHEDEEYMCLKCTTKQPVPKVGDDEVTVRNGVFS